MAQRTSYTVGFKLKVVKGCQVRERGMAQRTSYTAGFKLKVVK